MQLWWIRSASWAGLLKWTALCDGNLEKTWDANHPRFPDPPPSPESVPTQVLVYDELDRLVEVRRPWTGDGGGEAVTTYTYDVHDHLDSVTDAEGNTTTYPFSDDLLMEEVSPVAETTSYIYNGHGQPPWERRSPWRGVGNVVSIDRDDGVAATFGYQDVDYFLTGTSGPWPSRSWTYDRIGNRLTEESSGGTTTYDLNGSGGNTARLAQIDPAPVVGEGTAELGYDGAGDQTSWSWTRPEGAGVETVLLSYGYGGDRRLSRIERGGGATATDFVYDGRSFLREAHQTLAGSTDYVRTSPGYSSEGVLLARKRDVQSTTGGDSDDGAPVVTSSTTEAAYPVYFGDRPVAQVIRRSDELTPVFLTTDHLGSPILVTDTSGAVLWQGGVAPFGELFTLGAGVAAPDADPANPSISPSPPGEALRSGPIRTKALNFSTADVFLRYPGQWDDPAWGGYLPGGMYYNVHRWYSPHIGWYTKVDPLGLREEDLHPYLYAIGNPIVYSDATGEAARVCCTPVPRAPGPAKHCFIEYVDPTTSKSTTYGLQRVKGKGCKFKDDYFDRGAINDPKTVCGPWNAGCPQSCLDKEFSQYPDPSDYQLIRGPNSKSFARTMTVACNLAPPSIAGNPFQTPGWDKAGRPLRRKGFQCPAKR